MEQEKKKKQSSFSRLLEFTGNYKTLTILGCVLSCISTIMSFAPYVCIYFIIKSMFAAWPDLSSAVLIDTYGWCAMGFAAGSILVYFCGLLCTHLAAFRTAKNMKRTAMRHVVGLPMGYFSRQDSGRLRKIIDDNASLTETLLAHQIPDAVGAIVAPIVILILLFVFDWRLGILCLVPLIIGAVFQFGMYGGKNADAMKKYMDSLEDINAQAVEYVRGIPVVKVFQQTVYSFKNFYASIMNYKKFASDCAVNSRIPMVGFTVSSNAAFAFLIPAAILLIGTVADPRNFLLDFLFYILFAPACSSMLMRMLYAANTLMKAGQAVDRLDKILNEKALVEPQHPKKPQDATVSFENVTFTYAGATEPALNNMSFSVQRGKTLALVGPSGGGKTTAASLIPRFFDADNGSVKIGGVDVREIASEDLMRQVAFVFQDSRLFKDSILENIRAAKPGATREEVLAAVHAARCDDILEKLPNGLDTVIDADGVYVSGGEQQRIALARAILKDAPIVVLDEATAFADAENEAAIQKAFSALIKSKTVIMIAHRLTTIKNADEILVIDEGKVKERGNHDTLLKADGLYSQMWKDYQASIVWKVRKEAVK